MEETSAEPLGPIEVRGCARCGAKHTLTFYPFTRPVDPYTHWAMCPVLEEPILLQQEILD